MKLVFILISGMILFCRSECLPDSSLFYIDTAVLETDTGMIRIMLFEEKAFEHSKNFKNNILSGYYLSKPFHRIIPGFVIQTGRDSCTTSDKKMLHPEISKIHFKGAVGAARKGDEINPEMLSDPHEFYISLSTAPELDGKYTVFGRVAEGFETVEKIASFGSENGKPEKDIFITDTYIETYFDTEKYEFYKKKLRRENK